MAGNPLLTTLSGLYQSGLDIVVTFALGILYIVVVLL